VLSVSYGKCGGDVVAGAQTFLVEMRSALSGWPECVEGTCIL